MANNEERHYRELLILKTIAETLNQCNDLKHMLQSALEKLLELTDLQTGWIFLAEDEPIYHHMADHNLPPALSWEDKKPMKRGVCFCLGSYWAGELNQAVNIIECERLDDAVTHCWGDTGNLTHHATVPLTIRGERFGIMNVGSPGKEHFNAEELALLESVAYQIGTAVERTKLYEQQKKQVEYYAKIDEVIRSIWKISDLDTLFTTVLEQIGTIFGWSTTAIILKQQDRLTLHSMFRDGVAELLDESVSLDDEHATRDIIKEAHEKQQVSQTNSRKLLFPALQHQDRQSSIAVPLKIHETHLRAEPVGVLFISRALEPFLDYEVEILKLLADHISIAVEDIRIYEEYQELQLVEERNRLARDLHDSVNQKLFSLSLTARGVKSILGNRNEEIAEAVDDISQLAQEALSEMRSLIWQLRPYGLEKGVVTSLKEYAAKIGVYLLVETREPVHIPKKAEEALLRIGHEALNNVSKHAGTNRAALRVALNHGVVLMSISDRGRGFDMEQAANGTRSLGLTSMRERVSLIGGSLEVNSAPGKGTTVTVTVPIP